MTDDDISEILLPLLPLKDPYVFARAVEAWVLEQRLDHPVTRRTALGVLPVDVNTIDMLDRAVTAQREEIAALRVKLAAANMRAIELERYSPERARVVADALRALAHGLDGEEG